MRHMLDHARKAARLMAGKGRADVEADEILLLALTRLMEVFGEAASRVPTETRGRHPEIPWKAVVGLRNVLIHGYDSIDLDILWRVLSEDVPTLLPPLERAVEKETARP